MLKTDSNVLIRSIQLCTNFQDSSNREVLTTTLIVRHAQHSKDLRKKEEISIEDLRQDLGPIPKQDCLGNVLLLARQQKRHVRKYLSRKIKTDLANNVSMKRTSHVTVSIKAVDGIADSAVSTDRIRVDALMMSGRNSDLSKMMSGRNSDLSKISDKDKTSIVLLKVNASLMESPCLATRCVLVSSNLNRNSALLSNSSPLSREQVLRALQEVRGAVQQVIQVQLLRPLDLQEA